MRIGIRVCMLAAVSAYAFWAQATAGGGAVSGGADEDADLPHRQRIRDRGRLLFHQRLECQKRSKVRADLPGGQRRGCLVQRGGLGTAAEDVARPEPAGPYSWSHATGNTTGPLYAGVFPVSSVAGDSNPDKGNLPIDQRQHAVFNWTWQPRVTHSDSAAARFLANGWRFSGIATLASGQPVTPTVLLTGNQTSLFTMSYFNSLNGSGGWNRVPFEQIGSLQTGAQRVVDARVNRTLPFTERLHAEVAAEAFNLFNTQRITGVDTVAYTSVATLSSGLINGPYSGILKPVAGVDLGNASSAFPDGTTARRLQLAFRLIL